MPEWRECFAHLLMILTLFQFYKTSDDFRLLNIYVELPDSEAKKTGLCKEGKVERMTSSRRWKEVAKGKGKERSSLGPPALFEVQVKPEHVVLAAALNWHLEDVAGDGRSMMLIFDAVILKVCNPHNLPHEFVAALLRRTEFSA